MYHAELHPDSPARDLPNWVSDALDDISRATEADFRAAAPVDEDEDAALRRETRCKPADSVGVVLCETQIGLAMCREMLATQQAYVDAFPTLAAKVDYGDDIMRGLLPHLKANMRGAR